MQATGFLQPEGSRFASAAEAFNSLECREKAANARMGKRIVVALPREFDAETGRRVVEEYISRNLTSRGYAAAYAIHLDKDGNNPHAHIHGGAGMLVDACDGYGRIAARVRQAGPVRRVGLRRELRRYALEHDLEVVFDHPDIWPDAAAYREHMLAQIIMRDEDVMEAERMLGDAREWRHKAQGAFPDGARVQEIVRELAASSGEPNAPAVVRHLDRGGTTATVYDDPRLQAEADRLLDAGISDRTVQEQMQVEATHTIPIAQAAAGLHTTGNDRLGGPQYGVWKPRRGRGRSR